MTNPQAVAIGDQLHAEITQRADALTSEQFQGAYLVLTEDDQMYVEIGVQAGLRAALTVMVEKGWLRTGDQP